MFLEVKNLENFDPIWGFDPNISFKIRHFLVITLIDDPRGPFIGRKECIWDLLLQIVNFPTSILGAKPLWGNDFLNFLIPKKCPLYGRFTGVEKNFIRHFEVCEQIELEVCKWSPYIITTETQLYILYFYERCYVTSGLIVK